MSKMLSKMNLISVVQQLPKEDIETIQGYVEMIEEENQKLKLQLSGTTFCYDEEEHYCNRTDCSSRIKDSKKYDSLVQAQEAQQKKFISYLEDEIKTLEKDIVETVDDMDIYMKQVKSLIIEEILQKYKEIIEGKND